jgi:hypothetical protein
MLSAQFLQPPIAVYLLFAALMLARAAACGSPALPAQLQLSALDTLAQQLRHHSDSSAAGGGSSNGNAAGSTAGRSLMLAGAAALALGFVSLTGKLTAPDLITDSSSNSTRSDISPAAAVGSSSSSSVGNGVPPPGSLMGVLLSLAGAGKDSRASLRAVAALGYIAAGSSDQEVHMAAAKGALCSISAHAYLLMRLLCCITITKHRSAWLFPSCKQ